MSVYFVRAGDLIKIGFSNEVRRRVGSIIQNTRGGGEFLGYMAGDRRVERHLHDRFADIREYGEWFRASEALLALIEVVATKEFPDSERIPSQDRIRELDDRFVEDCAGYIRDYFRGLTITEDRWNELAAVMGMSVHRLRGIYFGAVESVTAGELVSLMQCQDIEPVPLSETKEEEGAF